MPQPNNLNPNVACMSFLGSTAVITGGVAGTGATIAAEILPQVGVPANGSIYISSHAGSPGIFNLQSGTWKWMNTSGTWQ